MTTTPTADEIRRMWVSDEQWRELEEAEEAVGEAIRDAYAETGGDREAGRRLLRRRLSPEWPLTDAFATVAAYNHLMAYALRNGLEPAPGERPGRMRRREGGPLPPVEQRRLAGILGVPLELLEEHADDN